MLKELYDVVWLKQYNSYGSDYKIASGLTYDKAIAKKKEWIEDSIKQNTYMNDEIMDYLRNARDKEVSVIARQTELPDEIPIDRNSVDLFVDSLIDRNKEAEMGLSRGFGNRNVTVQGIENRTKIIKAINMALEFDMKFKLVFYSDKITED